MEYFDCVILLGKIWYLFPLLHQTLTDCLLWRKTFWGFQVPFFSIFFSFITSNSNIRFWQEKKKHKEEHCDSALLFFSWVRCVKKHISKGSFIVGFKVSVTTALLWNCFYIFRKMLLSADTGHLPQTSQQK